MIGYTSRQDKRHNTSKKHKKLQKKFLTSLNECGKVNELLE